MDRQQDLEGQAFTKRIQCPEPGLNPPPPRQEVKDLPPTELILSHLNIRKTLEGQNSVN